MLEVAAFKNWNSSHFLDVAEMTAAVAIGYDWCYERLTSNDRTTIAAAIVQLGLQPGSKNAGWVKSDNNWNQVCHGGLTLGALALRDSEPKLASAIIRRAIKYVPRAMAVYAPDGAYPEGPAYWKYGTSYNVLLIEGLRSVLGTDAGLVQAPGFLDSGTFYRQARGSSGLLANYSDSSRDKGDRLASPLFWFAREQQQPNLLDNAFEQLAAWPGQAHETYSKDERLLPLLFLYAPSEVPQRAKDRPTSWAGGGPTPVAFHRNAWSKDATFVSLKGGSPGHNHGHMDIGSFIIDAGGHRWAEDLGKETYGTLEAAGLKIWNKEQGSERWTIFRHHVRSHNTLMIDGRSQRVDGHAKFIRHQMTGPQRFSILDMTPVYRDRLDRARRGVVVAADGTVVVRDELRPQADGSLRWAMLTYAEIDQIEPGLARLHQAGIECYMRIDAPAAASWTTLPTAPERDCEKDNAGSRMLGFTCPLQAGVDQVLQVSFHPTRPRSPKPLTPLSAW